MMNTLKRKFLPLILTVMMLSGFGCRIPLKVPPVNVNGPVPKIDWARMAEFAKASGDAYKTPAEIQAIYGKEHVVARELPASDTQYFIYFDHANQTQTISVRGTSSRDDAWSDINSIKVRDTTLGIFLHRGFKVAADAVYADSAMFLQRDYKTRVTGHSLGGAVAAILMLDLIKDGYNVEQVLTFGQPKITNEAGGKNVPTVYIRVINDGDAVPQVPPSNIVYDLSGPYQHFGPEIVLHDNKTFTFSPVHIPRDLFADDLWKTVTPEDIGDHQIKNYIERINALK